jgi:transposase-like protein
VKIHSTNVLERLNGEIKRRANVVGIFPNETAVRRLFCAPLMEKNDEYAIQNHYMSLESLATISENRSIRLPPAPALA